MRHAAELARRPLDDAEDALNGDGPKIGTSTSSAIVASKEVVVLLVKIAAFFVCAATDLPAAAGFVEPVGGLKRFGLKHPRGGDQHDYEEEHDYFLAVGPPWAGR